MSDVCPQVKDAATEEGEPGAVQPSQTTKQSIRVDGNVACVHRLAVVLQLGL